MQKWTPEEDAVVAANGDKTAREIGLMLGRSKRSITARRLVLGATGPLPRAWQPHEDDTIRQAVAASRDRRWSDNLAAEIAESIGRTPQAVRNRAMAIGCNLRSGVRKSSGRHSGRIIVGFDDAGPVYEHRAEMERHIGRKLGKHERVHHIDCDKDNNTIDNLYLCRSVGEHAALHHQLNDLTAELMRRGVIKFDRQSGRYAIAG